MTLTRRELLECAACGMSVSGLSSRLAAAFPQGPEDEAIRAYLASRAAELEREFLPGVTTSADFERIRPSLRAELLYMLGLDPLPERTPLKPVVTGRLERADFTVEKLHFQRQSSRACNGVGGCDG